MGQDKYPPLKPEEIRAILKARGFRLDRTRGDHEFYSCVVKGQEHIVQIDVGNPLVAKHWLKLTIIQSGMTRDEFYCSTESTAKKVGKQCASDDELDKWALLGTKLEDEPNI